MKRLAVALSTLAMMSLVGCEKPASKLEGQVKGGGGQAGGNDSADYAQIESLVQAIDEAREILGGCYSARESDTVEKNQSMRAERTFQVNGAPRYFDRHLSIGNDAGGVRGMRIYFDIIDGVATIAYCGKHLTVYSTN